MLRRVRKAGQTDRQTYRCQIARSAHRGLRMSGKEQAQCAWRVLGHKRSKYTQHLSNLFKLPFCDSGDGTD